MSYITLDEGFAWTQSGGKVKNILDSRGQGVVVGYELTSPPTAPVPFRLALAWLEAGGWIWYVLGECIFASNDGQIIVMDDDGNVRKDEIGIKCDSVDELFFCSASGATYNQRRIIELRHELAQLEKDNQQPC